MMPLTNRLSEVADFFFQLLSENKVQLGLADVFYGDQTLIPHTPTVCVETGEATQTLVGIPRRVDVAMELYLLIYIGDIRSTILNRQESETLADILGDFIHDQDPRLAGLVIHTFVSKTEFGYSAKANGTVFRVARITVSLQSKVNL